jgi:hypothetical protein
MPRGHLLDLLPPWLTFVGTVALVLLSIYGGIFLAHFRRKRSLHDQEMSVSAIETTFLRAGLIPEPHGTAVRALLKEYVDIRVELARHPENIEQAVGATTRTHVVACGGPGGSGPRSR